MKKTIQRIIDNLDDKTEKEFGYRVEPIVIVEDLGRKTAGLADYFENTIWLNSLYLSKYKKEMLYGTLPHEYAHMLCVFRFGLIGIKRKKYYSHHGKEWKDCMRFLGFEPEIYHNMIL